MRNLTRKDAETMNLLFEEESYNIRGAAFEVYKKLGCGHKEIVYRKAMAIALEKRNLKAEQEKKLPVYFDNQQVGTYVPDIIVNKLIIIELKAKPFVAKNDIKQFWDYLTSTKYELGFLINFGKAGGVEVVRRVYQTARAR